MWCLIFLFSIFIILPWQLTDADKTYFILNNKNGHVFSFS